MPFWTRIKLVTMLGIATFTLGGIDMPISSDAAEPAQSTSSKPVVQNGLQVVLMLPKVAFAVDEPLKFTMQFKNVSDKPFSLYDADYFWNWRITFEDHRKIGVWRLSKLFKDQRIRPESKLLNPGESLDVPVVLDQEKPRIAFVWEGLERKSIEPTKNLSNDKYELVVEVKLQASPIDAKPEFPFWTGAIKTNPIEFEITSK